MIWNRRTKPRRGPSRDADYLKWIRTLPCVVCALPQRGPTEAAHTGPHGISQKSSDYSVIPLCWDHHQRGNDSYHRLGWRFFQVHGIEIEELIASLVAGYAHHLVERPEKRPVQTERRVDNTKVVQS